MKDINKILTSIILRAGEIILSAHNVESDGSVSEKAGDAANMVTKYDVAVQNFIISEIKKEIPGACFIAEEKENDEKVLAGEFCFIIDPIDGTANFVHDYRHSCISLALFSHSEAMFAAIYDPFQKELFSAEKGKGAFLNGRPMRVSERTADHAIVAYGTSPYYKKELGNATFELAKRLFMRCSDVRRCGAAALDLAYLAAGRNDMFFEYKLSPWDIAAGSLLIKEAGGVITDMEGNEIDFSSTSSVIAANPTVYGVLLETVKEI